MRIRAGEAKLRPLFSLCYLGIPYEVHMPDAAGQSIELCELCKQGEALPGGPKKARGRAVHGGYGSIEGYSNRCRAIGANGSVSVIGG